MRQFVLLVVGAIFYFSYWNTPLSDEHYKMTGLLLMYMIFTMKD